ncbi:MAG: hypothetical protein GY799_22995 [Desulfobulbaceae bacterium]|nr:hypothetical protein [Desulfobulbaceae bacterium]
MAAGTILETIFSYHADTVALGTLAERAAVPHLVSTHLIPQPGTDVEEEAFVHDVTREFFTWDVPDLPDAVRQTMAAGMRSRFVFPPDTPELLGPALIDHCWTEMTHLAGFLPRLHTAATAAGQPGTAQ